MHIIVTKYHPSTKAVQQHIPGFKTEQDAIDGLDAPFNPAQTIAEHFPNAFVIEEPTGSPIGWVVDDADPENKTVAYSDPVSLSDYKEACIEANRNEAESRIASLFSLTPKSRKMKYTPQNYIRRYIELLEKELTAPPPLSTTEQNEKNDILAINTATDAILNAENAAATLINNAANKTAVDAVKTPSWP